MNQNARMSGYRLQQCMDALERITALPARSAECDQDETISNLLDMLLESMDVDFARLHFGSHCGASFSKFALSVTPQLVAHYQRWFAGWQNDDFAYRQIAAPVGSAMNVAKARIDLFGSVGWLSVGSFRPDFPDRTDRLILNVAANQALVGLQHAQAPRKPAAQVGQLDEGSGLRTQATDMVYEQGRRQELDFRLIVDSIPVPVAVTTPQGEVEGVNRQTVDYFGKTFDELKTWKTSELVHPDDLERTIAAQVAAHQNGTTYDVQSRHRRHDGEYRWFNVLGVPLRDSRGDILRWLHLIIDVDDQKRAEEALSASENHLTQIVNSLPGLAWAASTDGLAEYFNQRYLDYTGLTFEEALGEGWTRAVHPDDLQGLVKRWVEILRHGGASEAEARLRRHDGAYRWFLFRTNPLLNERGDVIKWFGVNTDIEDRKIVEENLRHSEINLRQMTETIPQMLWSATKDGAIDYCNHKLLDYTGFTAPELMNAGWVKLLHPGDVERAKAVWAESVATGAPYQIEVRTHHAADGQFRWLLTNAMPLRGEDGTIQRWYGTCIDIHDRKEAEAAIARSEKSLAQIIDSIPVYVWSALSDGGVEFLNRHYLAYLGVSQDEVQGWGLLSKIHPDDVDSHVGHWRKLLATETSGEWQTRLRRHDGAYRWFLHRANALKDGSGAVKWFGVTIDIEELKRAEEKLRASELNLRRQTETIPQMLWSAKPDGVIDYCNTQFANFIGYLPLQTIDSSWKDCIHPEDVDQTSRMWKSCVETGAPFRAEARFVHASSGSFRWCVTTGLPLRDENGQILKWHGSCVDMHDWKLAQDELRVTQAELAHLTRVMTMGQLTASIAHELNQPLAGILMNASTGLRMLSSTSPNVQGAAETAKRTIRDAKRASEVIARLRALFSKKAPAAERVNLNAAVQEIISLTSHEIARHGVYIVSDFDRRMPYIYGDRVQIQQVVLNFILNGIESMEGISDREKKLIICTELGPEGRVYLSVKDTGCGFDEEKTERLFSPFFTTKPSGMGIGLSVSRTIIESHNGVLSARRNDGPGSVFTFSLPVDALPSVGIGPA